MDDGPDDRAEFARRVRLQVQSRYSATAVTVDEDSFALRLVAPGIDVRLPLAPLHHAYLKSPANGPIEIARFVQFVERRLEPAALPSLDLRQMVWCVRSREYLADLARRDDMLTRELGGDLIAFVAETLPGMVMRGVAATEWRERGMDDEAVAAAADAATAARFERVIGRITEAERIPEDGWRLSGDQLFEGSAMLVPAVRAALVRRANGPVLLANPDRSVVLAVPADAPAAERFHQRALREWREAMHASSREVYRTGGEDLSHVPRPHGGRRVLPWLSD